MRQASLRVLVGVLDPDERPIAALSSGKQTTTRLSPLTTFSTWQTRVPPTVSKVQNPSEVTLTEILDERMLAAAKQDNEELILEVFEKEGSFDINFRDGCVEYCVKTLFLRG